MCVQSSSMIPQVQSCREVVWLHHLITEHVGMPVSLERDNEARVVGGNLCAVRIILAWGGACCSNRAGKAPCAVWRKVVGASTAIPAHI